MLANCEQKATHHTSPPAYPQLAVKDNLPTHRGDDTVNDNTDAAIMTYFLVMRNTSKSWQHLPTTALLLIRTQHKYPLRFLSPVLH